MDDNWTERDVQKFLDEKMELDKLVFWPNSLLNKPGELVTDFQKGLETAELMWKVMGAAEGIGIAAPQIGVSQKIICISVDETHLMVANPIIGIPHENRKKVMSQEGCLSFPSIYVKVERWEEVTLMGNELVNAENRLGKLQTWRLTGKAAIVAQHETDHVNGITMVDHLSSLKRDVIRRKILKEDRLKGRF